MINGTLVKACQQQFLIPNSDFCQTVKVNKQQIYESNINHYCLEHDNNVIPLLPIQNILFGKEVVNLEGDDFVAALVEHKKKKFALLLDDIVSQEKIILKKLDEEIEAVNGIMGGAILGDGNVVLVMEVKEIIEDYLQVS